MDMTERNETTQAHDPYARCDEGCTHDLATGVLVGELRNKDGPFRSIWDRVISSGGFSLWGNRLRQDDESAT